MTIRKYIDRKQFPLAVAAKVAGVPTNTLKAWIARDIITLTEARDRPGEGRGSARLLSFRRLLQVTITAELARHGLAPSHGAQIAAAFTDTASGSEHGEKRLAGDYYGCGETILVAYPGCAHATVIRLDDDTRLTELIGPDRSRSAIVVWVNGIERRIRDVLDQLSKDEDHHASP